MIKNNIFNITWYNFEKKLYQIVISEIDLLNQFDTMKNIQRINEIPKREILYSKFLDFLKNLQTPHERQNVLRFICGKIAIIKIIVKIILMRKLSEKPRVHFP
jgi:hypothetical protein